MMLGFVVVAGGLGTRIGGCLPKQFLDINGYPIIVHTLSRILACPEVSQVWLVLPKDWVDYWKTVVYPAQAAWRLPITVVCGGNTRTESVWAALQEIRHISTPPAYLAIHDACRPLITNSLISHVFQVAQKLGNAVPMVPLKSSLRKITHDGDSVACNRDDFREVQTPQIFYRSQLLEAYQNLYNQNFTDDASLVEAAGFPIHLAAGIPENIKITTKEDLLFAANLLQKPDNQ